MPDIALRPRSATELVDAAFQLYRRNPLPFVTAFALLYVPWMVVVAVTGHAGAIVGSAAPDPNDIAAQLLTKLSQGVAFMLGSGVVTVLCRDAYFERELDIAAAFRAMFRRSGDIVIASLGVGICSAVAAIAFLIPGFYVYGRLFATKQVILLENKSGGSAIGRSWSLTKGNVWHILKAMALAFLLNFGVGLGVFFFASLIPSEVIQLFVSTVVLCFVYPLVGIIETMVYYDIRIRREGFDIEYLASATSLSSEQSAAT